MVRKMIERDFDNNNENSVEWLSKERMATVSFTNQKHINRIKKLYEERSEDFKYFKENKDGSICAKIPLKWIKINAGSKTGRVMTDEQKEAARIRLQEARKKMSRGNK